MAINKTPELYATYRLTGKDALPVLPHKRQTGYSSEKFVTLLEPGADILFLRRHDEALFEAILAESNRNPSASFLVSVHSFPRLLRVHVRRNFR
jgi:hypothetical protein